MYLYNLDLGHEIFQIGVKRSPQYSYTRFSDLITNKKITAKAPPWNMTTFTDN